MNDIRILYSNKFGIAFFWNRSSGLNYKKLQLVFRDTGLELSLAELSQFTGQIKAALNRPPSCTDCKRNKYCKSVLLQTPAPQISFAMSYHELEMLQDLVKGAHFQLELDAMLR